MPMGPWGDLPCPDAPRILEGRCVLITGGRRLGANVGVELAREGADVAFVYHESRQESETAAAAVRALGRRALALQADLRAPDECQRIVDLVADDLRGLHVLVNMASVYTRTPFDALTLDDWEAPLQVDLRATWLCSQTAVRHMRRAGWGRIVNFADTVARSGRPLESGYLPYYVAKAGVIALTEALALEVAAYGICVNAVAPGPVLPPSRMSASTVEEIRRTIPLGHWGKPVDVEAVVKALICTDFITGESIRVDGGTHLR